MERRERREDAEEERRQRHEHEPAEEDRSRSARASAATRGSGGIDSSCSVQTASTTARPASAVKTTARPTSAAAAPTHGPEERAEHGRADRGTDQLAAALARRGGEQPREGAGPREAAAAALQETGRGERPEALGESEAEAREPHQRQPDEHCTPRAEPGGGRSSRIPPTSAPAAYAATSTPAPVFERWSVCAKWGRSGVSAA